MVAGAAGRFCVAPSGLNPLAPVFTPKAQQRVNGTSVNMYPWGGAEGFGQLPDEVQSSDGLPCKGPEWQAADSATNTIQVLATVLSCLDQPQDVFACALASRHMKAIAEHAPVRLRVCSVPKIRENADVLPQLLQAVTVHFKGKSVQCTTNRRLFSPKSQDLPVLQVYACWTSATQWWTIQTSAI